jgi:hypothetical protein
LALKDDLSHFVEFVPSERTDNVVVVHALVDWYKRFGVAETHVSDKGSHFKNKVVAELIDILMTKHYFTTAYSSKSNGTVERVNREIMKEQMKSADASQSPDLEGGDDCFQEDGDETLLDQAIAGMLQRASMYLSEGQFAKPPTFGAECLERLQVGKPAGQAPITVFTCLPAYNPLAVVLQGIDVISFKQ